MSLPLKPSKFVRDWFSNKTMDELAKAHSVSIPTVYSWSQDLRKAGVNLPSRNATRRIRLNVDKLNALIEKHK